MDYRSEEKSVFERYPISFLDQGKLSGLPAPLVRMRACGLLEVAVLKEVVSQESVLRLYKRCINH